MNVLTEYFMQTRVDERRAEAAVVRQRVAARRSDVREAGKTRRTLRTRRAVNELRPGRSPAPPDFQDLAV